MSTRTLLEKEAKGNSEMAFSIMLMMGITMRKIRRIITGTVMILKFTKGDRGDNYYDDYDNYLRSGGLGNDCDVDDNN